MERFQSLFGEVELTDEREQHILEFHPNIKPYRNRFAEVLAYPDIKRRSNHDPDVIILYRRIREIKYLALVVKRNKRNFILTAYTTKRLKQHEKSSQ